MTDTYESLPQNLQLRVNAHIANAFALDDGFLNEFRRMAQFSSNGNGREGAQKTLNMLRDAMASKAEGLAPVNATNVTAAQGQIRDLQRQLIGVIGDEVDRVSKTGKPSWNEHSYIAGVVNSGFIRINENKDARTDGSDLSLRIDQLSVATGKMGALAAASDAAAKCMAQVNESTTCASVPRVVSQQQNAR